MSTQLCLQPNYCPLVGTTRDSNAMLGKFLRKEDVLSFLSLAHVLCGALSASFMCVVIAQFIVSTILLLLTSWVSVGKATFALMCREHRKSKESSNNDFQMNVSNLWLSVSSVALPILKGIASALPQSCNAADPEFLEIYLYQTIMESLTRID